MKDGKYQKCSGVYASGEIGNMNRCALQGLRGQQGGRRHECIERSSPRHGGQSAFVGFRWLLAVLCVKCRHAAQPRPHSLYSTSSELHILLFQPALCQRLMSTTKAQPIANSYPRFGLLHIPYASSASNDSFPAIPSTL
eukprot:3907477-Pleurochrysis_carterae.AAC.1